ncbi:MAG: hypothetical protein ACYTAF_03660 [Planctomycetota bacterium]|jgi:hypothetical protein
MRHLIALTALLLAACTAAAQEGYDKVKVGDRIDIILKNGNSLGGLVKLPARLTIKEHLDVKTPEAFDLSKETDITLDLSAFNPALGSGARITLHRSAIASIRILDPLTPAEKKRLKEALEREKERIQRDEDDRRAREVKRNEEIEKAAAARKELDDKAEESANTEEEKARLKKALAVYQKFPPPAWGPERQKEIARKNFLHLPVTLDELEFQENIDLWYEAHQFYQKTQKEIDESEKKKTEEAEKEETKKEEKKEPKKEGDKGGAPDDGGKGFP